MLNITCIVPSLCSEKSYAIIKRCIFSLRNAEAISKKVNLKIIVVSNGKQIVLKDLSNEIDHLLRYKKRYSFAAMNNKAIKFAIKKDKPDWIMLLNDDAFIRNDFFSQFLKTIDQEKDIEVVAPLVYEDGTKIIDSYGVEYFNSGYAKNNNKISTQTQLASAACLLVKKTLMKQIFDKYGFYFNEILTSYMEDVDLALRIRAQNKKIIKSKTMIVDHIVSFTNKRKSYYVMYHTYRNILWLIIMDWPLINIIKNLHNITLVQCWIIIFNLSAGRPLLYLKVLFDTAKNFKELIQYRNKIIKSYNNKFDFADILSRYAFRTYQGYKIRLF